MPTARYLDLSGQELVHLEAVGNYALAPPGRTATTPASTASPAARPVPARIVAVRSDGLSPKAGLFIARRVLRGLRGGLGRLPRARAARLPEDDPAVEHGAPALLHIAIGFVTTIRHLGIGSATTTSMFRLRKVRGPVSPAPSTSATRATVVEHSFTSPSWPPM
jgi:hypothetical protein